MRWDHGRRSRIAGILEKVGITALIAGVGDVVVTRQVSPALDATSIVLGLIALTVSVIISFDE